MRPLVAIFAVLVLVPALAEADRADRKKEIRAFRKELRYVDLRAREDLRADGPAPAAGAVTELEDGTVYVQSDSGIVFEKLSLLRFNKLALRGGHRLLVHLHPPSNIRPSIGYARSETGGRLEGPAWVQAGPTGPRRGRSLVTSLDLDEHPSVRAALSTLVFLPGTEPSAGEFAACLNRYPNHSEATSRMRCGEKK